MATDIDLRILGSPMRSASALSAATHHHYVTMYTGQLRDASVVFRLSAEQPILPTGVARGQKAKGNTDKQP